jgi:hypothetical protein
MENYSKGNLLGKGSFGSAWLCTSKLDAKNYVIKEVDISRMPRAEREAAEQEAKVRCLPFSSAAAVQQTAYCLALHAAVMLPSSCSLHPSYSAMESFSCCRLSHHALACSCCWRSSTPTSCAARNASHQAQSYASSWTGAARVSSTAADFTAVAFATLQISCTPGCRGMLLQVSSAGRGTLCPTASAAQYEAAEVYCYSALLCCCCWWLCCLR